MEVPSDLAKAVLTPEAYWVQNRDKNVLKREFGSKEMETAHQHDSLQKSSYNMKQKKGIVIVEDVGASGTI